MKVIQNEIYIPYILPLILTIERKICKYFSVHRPCKELNLVQHYMISEIFRLQGSCTSNDIVKNTYIDKGTVSKYIKKLSQQGYIKLSGSVFESDSVDEHSTKKNIELEEKGRTIAKSIFIQVCKIQNDIISLLEENEKIQMDEFLQMIFIDIYGTERDFKYDNEKWPMFLTYMLQVKRNIELMANNHEHDSGMELNQIFILLSLLSNEGKLNFKELEHITGTVQSCIATQVKKLSEKYMVTSIVHEADKRAKYCMLTEKGTETAKKYGEYLTGFEIKYCKNRENIIVYLNKICNIVDKMSSAV